MLWMIGACIMLGPAAVIQFPKGHDFVVSIQAGSQDSDFGLAYLVGNGIRKPIAEVFVGWDVNWFMRRDGSAVLLLHTSNSLRAFTITRSGKVYQFESPWNHNAKVIYCDDSTAVLKDFVYTGEDPPSGRIVLVSLYGWSKSQMKWVKRAVGFN